MNWDGRQDDGTEQRRIINSQAASTSAPVRARIQCGTENMDSPRSAAFRGSANNARVNRKCTRCTNKCQLFSFHCRHLSRNEKWQGKRRSGSVACSSRFVMGNRCEFRINCDAKHKREGALCTRQAISFRVSFLEVAPRHCRRIFDDGDITVCFIPCLALLFLFQTHKYKLTNMSAQRNGKVRNYCIFAGANILFINKLRTHSLGSGLRAAQTPAP